MASKLPYLLNVQNVVSEYSTDQSNGLTNSQAEERLRTYGKNQLKAKKSINPLLLFINQFKDVLVIVLIVSALVSFALSFVSKSNVKSPDAIGLEIAQQLGCDRADKSQARKTDTFCQEPAKVCDTLDAATVSQLCSDLETSREANEGPKEAILIISIVIAIALIGFFNEYKAEKTVEALKNLLSSDASVKRNGKIIKIASCDIVPGDIVVLHEGEKIPADLRLISVRNLLINEASLTGESLPVEKTNQLIKKISPLGDQINMAFSGTFVSQGTAEGIVVATAQDTELGKIASLVNDVVEEETPMQRKLDDLGKRLGVMIMIICALVFVIVLIFVKEARDKEIVARMIFAFTAAVALAVAAIPEGLAFVVRISLALGARRMASKNALVRRLSAVEALGSTDVICSDKTGTLTKGEMTVRSCVVGSSLISVSGSGYQRVGTFTIGPKEITKNIGLERLLTIGSLCNDSQLKSDGGIIGDPTEASLLVSGAKFGIDYEKLAQLFIRKDEIPFTSDRKRMSTIHTSKNGFLVATKGATEIVLDLCTSYMDEKGSVKPLSAAMRSSILDHNLDLSKQALRVLAFAQKELKSVPSSDESIEKGLTFIGLQGMMDPPRVEVSEVIRRVQSESGMRVIMITGDYIETAKAVAKEIGIIGDAMSGSDIDGLTDEEFVQKIQYISVFARVNPEHKIRIVQSLKKLGHQVAMTGDGVNDAPAIKAANIGIAMGINGTDAAKEAADLILLDDQFLTIIAAIEEGRGIFENVRKFVNFLISCNIAEVIAIVLGIVFFNNLLLTAAQLLFINIVTDGLPAVALGSDPSPKDALKQKPSYFQQAILTKRVWAEIVVFGFLMSIILLGQYWYNHTHESTIAAVSAAFTSMVVFEMVRLVDIRTDYRIKWLANPWLTVAIIISVAMQFAVLYISPLASSFDVGPLSGHDWVIMAIGSIVLFVAMKLLNPLFDKIDHRELAKA